MAGLILLFGVSPSIGLAVVSLGIAIDLGGWALVAQWRSERFDFLEATHDLYSLREALARSNDRVEWVTWASTIVCERAGLASGSASPSNRRKLLRDMAHLIRFANPIVERMDKRGFRQLNHLLLACEELDGWPEVVDEPGDEIIEALSYHLGEPQDESTFHTYVSSRREAMKHVDGEADRYNDAFDREYFISLLDA